MKKNYDFSKGKRGPVSASAGKTRVTIYLDDAILKHFKGRSVRSGKGYQTLINDALCSVIGREDETLTPKLLRQIVREEMAARN